MKKQLSRQNLNITVVTQPEVIQKGQLLEVSVAVTNPEGRSVTVPRIYMEIVDSKGMVVWPLSVIAVNTSGFTRLISTRELKTNTRYNVRTSINPKLVRHSFSWFKTGPRLFPGLLSPLALAPLLVTPEVIVPETSRGAEMLVYNTEHDTRVCPICLNYAGRTYKPDDPNLPRIGPKEHGGSTHWGCRCNYLVIGVLNAAFQKATLLRSAALAAMAVQKVKTQRRNR